MNVLLFTSVFPSSARPNHGLFVLRRVKAIESRGRVKFDTLIPVVYSRASVGLSDAHVQQVDEVTIPGRRDATVIRYPFWPKFDSPFGAAPMLASTSIHMLARMSVMRSYHAIDAHNLFPDGIVGAALSRLLSIPLILTARGTDVNSALNHPLKRWQIMKACAQASRITAVSTSLKSRLEEIGVSSGKIDVILNGVDHELFNPNGRRELNQNSVQLLTVGLLDRRKRQDIVIRIAAAIPECVLTIVGHGPEKSNLVALVDALGIRSRVRFLGQVPHRDMPEIYRGADILVHAAEREGLANVLIESVASGTPVVALDRWGAREVISEPTVGRLVADQSVERYVEAIRNVISLGLTQMDMQRTASKFSWEESARRHEEVLLGAASESLHLNEQ
jgi:teichuronic acid biosynthesis glycosyltransferase TuaC